MDTSDPHAPLRPASIRLRWLPELLIVLGLGLIIAVWVYQYRTTRTAFVTLTESLLDSIGDRVEQEVSDFLQPAEQLVQLMVEFSEITRFSTARRSVLTPLSYKIIQSYDHVAMVNIGDQRGGYNMSFKHPDGSIDMQFIEITDEGKQSYWVKRPTPGEPPLIETIPNYEYDPRNRPWYTGALNTSGVFWTDVYIFHTGEAAGITASQAVRNDEGEVIGVVGIDLEMSSLSQLLMQLPLGEDGRAYILDGSGQVIVRSNEPAAISAPQQLVDLEDKAAMRVYQHYRIQGNTDQVHTVDDIRFITTARSLDTLIGYPWTLIAVTPENNFADLADNPRRGLALLLGGGLGLALMTTGLVTERTRKASRKIEHFSHQTQRAEQRAQHLARLYRQGFADTSLQAMIERLAANEPCKRISVWKLDTQHMLVCLNAYDRLSGNHTHGARVRIPQPLTDHSDEEVFVIDPDAPTPLWRDWVDQYARPLHLSTILAAPILHRQRCIGVLCCEYTDEHPHAVDNDLPAARCIAEACVPYLIDRPTSQAPSTASSAPSRSTASPLPQRSRGLTRSPIPSWIQTQPTGQKLAASEQACAFTALFDNEAFLSSWIETEQQTAWGVIDQWLSARSSQLRLHRIAQVGNLTTGLIDPQLGAEASATAAAQLLTRLRKLIQRLETAAGTSADCRFGADIGLVLVAADPRCALLGEAVANARELAHTAQANTIHVSAAFQEFCSTEFHFQQRGAYFISNLGTVTTFQLESV